MTFEEFCAKHLKLNDCWEDLRTCHKLFEDLKKDNKKMKKRLEFLDALEEAGVDNWEGISHAHEIINNNIKEEGFATEYEAEFIEPNIGKGEL